MQVMIYATASPATDNIRAVSAPLLSPPTPVSFTLNNYKKKQSSVLTSITFSA
jgi:hypothetical protein